MSRRGENIRKRKDGRWEGRYIKERDFQGKAKYASVYGKSYSEVKTKLADASAGKHIQSTSADINKNFGEILILWMNNNRIKNKGATVNKYRYLIERHLQPELGKLKMSQLSASLINSFLEKKLLSGRLDNKGGLSPAYVRSMAIIINSAIEFAVNEEICAPLKNSLYKPTSESKSLNILSPAQQKQFEKTLLNDMDETKLGIYISLHTGLRIGEICALKWSNIDLDERIIRVHATIARVPNDNNGGSHLIIDVPKTKSSLRDIPISSVLFPILKNMKKQSVSQFVVSSQNTFTSPRTYEYRYHKILEKCSITPINYHALRHTFATRCIEAGVDIKSLSEILGHSNVSITLNTYVHSSMDLKRKQIEKLYNVLSA